MNIRINENTMKKYLVNASQGSQTMKTYNVTQAPPYNTDTTMAVPESYYEELLHLISCERYHELQANHF